MPESSGEKLCPICDSPLQPGSKKCGFCGTDLSIFEIETEMPKRASEPVSAPPKMSVESRIEEIFSKPLIPGKPPVREQPKPEPVVRTAPPRPAPVETKRAPPPAPPVMREPEPSPEPEVKEEPEPEAVEYFECPQCGSRVESSASSCPKCGVFFAEEGTEMFQCPACNTLVSVDAKSCPGCGAMFVEPDEASPAESAPALKRDLEPPLAEVKPAPTAKLERELRYESELEEEKEAEEVAEKKGLLSKEIVGVRWEGGRVASMLNADTELNKNILRRGIDS